MYKKIALLLLLAVVIASCGARKTATTSTKNLTGTQQDIIDYGMKYLNKPYRYAGKGPNAFDCSGFTSFVFKKFGFHLNPSSTGQDKQLPTVRRKEDLQVGDLVFFEGRSHNGRVGHVGIVKEIFPNGEFQFLHASTSNGVIVSRSTEPYYASRYLRGGRVLQENNRLAIVEKTPDKKTKTTDKRKNAFTPAKAKEQIVTKVPKTEFEKEMENAIAQNPDIPKLETPKSDTLIIHSRPIDKPLSDSTSSKKQSDKEVDQLVAQAIIRTDTTTVPKPIETKIANTDSILHEVKPGETLYSISRKYNCSVEQIKEWNPQLGSILKSGDSLKIYQQATETPNTEAI
ncbi:MAG: NlpC/P60 family protein [Bacteroidia bacterium]|nr:NlpC/P60 family protein [Bacteroidia bacterium]